MVTWLTWSATLTWICRNSKERQYSLITCQRLLDLASNRDYIITITIIDFNRYWVATLFNLLVIIIVRRLKDVVWYILSYRFTRAFMHAGSILTPCHKVCYNYSKNNIPPCTIHQSQRVISTSNRCRNFDVSVDKASKVDCVRWGSSIL